MGPGKARFRQPLDELLDDAQHQRSCPKVLDQDSPNCLVIFPALSGTTTNTRADLGGRLSLQLQQLAHIV